MDVSPIKDRVVAPSLSFNNNKEDDRKKKLVSIHFFLPMENILRPTNQDVLCGRGVTTNRHPGNESFRALVNCNKELYVSSTKKNKMMISRSIVDAVRSKEPQPGRFLEKNSQGTWFDIGDKKAIEKTSQALRDGAAHLRKQLSEDLSDPDFLNAVFSEEPPIITTTTTTTADRKSHRRIQSDPAACLHKQPPQKQTSQMTEEDPHTIEEDSRTTEEDFDTTEVEQDNNISPPPSHKRRKSGENMTMMMKTSNSFTSPVTPVQRNANELSRATPQRRNPPLPLLADTTTDNSNNTRHRRHHTLTGSYNYSNENNNDDMNDTLMQETVTATTINSNSSVHAHTRRHTYNTGEQMIYHPSSPYAAHSSPARRTHSPYHHSPYHHSVHSPTISRSNSPYHHSVPSPTVSRPNSPYHHSVPSPTVSRPNSPYHHPAITQSNSHDSNHYPGITQSDSYDSYHPNNNNNAYRNTPPPYHPPPPRSNTIINKDMYMPEFNTNTNNPDNKNNRMRVSFINNNLNQHPTSPHHYNPTSSHSYKHPLPHNNNNHPVPLQLMSSNGSSFNRHANTVTRNQSIQGQNDKIIKMEEDIVISNYEDLKMISPLPFNMDDPANRYERERTISENTLIGLQHL